MLWCIEVRKRGRDPEAEQLRHELRELGGKLLRRLRVIRLYYLGGNFDKAEVRAVAARTFADPVVDRFRIVPCPGGTAVGVTSPRLLEVLYNPGVSDPSEASIQRALAEVLPADSGRTGSARGQVRFRSGRRYEFVGPLSGPQVQRLARELLYNPLVQHIARPGERVFVPAPGYRFTRVEVPLRSAGSRELQQLSRRGQLALNLTEMRTIQRHYHQLGRDPTDVELETFAQTWSEHCKHKTFQGRIVFDGRRLSNLFRQTIQRVTRELNPDWCLSVFKDNSGVIAFDRRQAIAFKVETHNHPSALEPYGGAATGIGGVIRDCLGTGLAARPILNTDVFCFAPPDFPRRRLPPGVLHPKRVLKGVVSGVRDYGNRMGIPTACGALYFHEGFHCNPLVFCGTLGLIPRNRLRKRIRSGDHIVLMGARTGRDGIHGVTFASLGLTADSEAISSSAVQIGNPIEEKKVTDAILRARDLELFNAVTDCGGGGLASAVGELAATRGCVVDLDLVPLKYAGLSCTEIWISESQERMLLFVGPSQLPRLLRLCRQLDVEATAIGRVTTNHRLVLRYEANIVADIDLEFLHSGWSRQQRVARTRRREFQGPAPSCRRDLSTVLLRLLSSPNVSSKEWVIRQYDHEVQGMSVVKPFAGFDGPSDGCVLQPVADSPRGVVVGCGLNPRFGLVDTYNMAVSAIDEALRNVTACGGDPDRTALLDNFCWGSPERPDQLAGFVRAAQACYDAARGFRAPFISGKDSFYNEYRAEDGRLHPIPPTLLISAVSIIPDCRRAVTSDLKPGHPSLYLIGATRNELGGSEYHALFGALGGNVPSLALPRAREIMRRLHRAVRTGLVVACHDLSEGGLGVALAEMCLAGRLGIDARLDGVPLLDSELGADGILFSESNSRFLVQARTGCEKRFELLMRGLPARLVGMVNAAAHLNIEYQGRTVVSCPVADLDAAWRSGLTRLL